MRESKRATALRAIRCFNNYDLLKRFGDAATYAIEYHPYESNSYLGWCRTYAWTAPDKERRKYGCEMVYAPARPLEFHGKRAESWPAALAWVQEVSGHTYVASPFGGHIPEQVLQRALAAADNQKKGT